MLKNDPGLLPSIGYAFASAICFIGMNYPDPLPISWLRFPGIMFLSVYLLLGAGGVFFAFAAIASGANWIANQRVRRHERWAEAEHKLALAKSLTPTNRTAESLAQLGPKALSIAYAAHLLENYGDYEKWYQELSLPDNELEPVLSVPKSDEEKQATLRRGLLTYAMQHDGAVKPVREMNADEKRAWEWLTVRLGELIQPATSRYPARITNMRQALETLKK